MKRFAICLALSLSLGCWKGAVDQAAQTTVLIDEQFASVYENVSDICLQKSDNWAEYDNCIEPWNKEAALVARLREVTLQLDVASGRNGKKAAGCAWFQAVVDVYDVPARRVALQSKWRWRC